MNAVMRKLAKIDDPSEREAEFGRLWKRMARREGHKPRRFIGIGAHTETVQRTVKCGHPECERMVRKTNITGLCSEHYQDSVRARFAPRKTCSHDGCDVLLGSRSKTGKCKDHYERFGK